MDTLRENGENRAEPAGTEDRIESAETGGPVSGLSHTDVVLPAAISAGLAALSILEDGLFEAFDFGDFNEFWIRRITLYSMHLPVYATDMADGLVLSAATAGFVLSGDRLFDLGDVFFAQFLLTNAFDVSLFSTYAAYANNRPRARPGLYDDAWREASFVRVMPSTAGLFGGGESESAYSFGTYGFFDLALSPFDPVNISDYMVFLLPVAGFVQPFLENTHENAIWNTGRAYVGNYELSPALAIPLMGLFLMAESVMIGVCEEAHFRGFIYEELGSNYGDLAAKIVDALYFSVIHLPTDLYIANADGYTAAGNVAQRALLTVYLDCLYDRGGLPRSVAAHTWIDFSLLFSSYLVRGGAPQSGVGSLLALFPAGLNLEFRIRL